MFEKVNQIVCNAAIKYFVERPEEKAVCTPGKTLVKMPGPSKRTKSWTAYLLGSDPSRRFLFTGIKGVLIGVAISLVITSGMLGPVTAQRTSQQQQQQKQGGPSYSSSSNDEKIPTAQ